MPENVRALIVILGLALPVFWLARKPVTEVAIVDADFRRRRNLWLLLTVTSFLCYSFWVYAAVAAVALIVAGRKDSNRLGVYAFVMFAVPPAPASVPGFGVVNYLLDLDHLRLLALFLLLPSYLTLRRQPDTAPFGRWLADKLLLGYLILQLALQWQVDTVTNTGRNAVYGFVDVFLPYYVASRGLRDAKGYLDVLMSFVIACLVMAPVAAFEYVKHWLLYSTIAGNMGLYFGMGTYVNRGDSLRAVASMGHSLVLGYSVAVALAFYVFVCRAITSRMLVAVGCLALLIGLIAPVSRGPWVGGAVALTIVLATGPDKISRMGRFLAIAIPIGGAVLLTPMGDKIIDLLPFIGSVDEFNVTYRQRLFDISVAVIKMNPWFGSFDYLANPLMQELVQGEGIIDLVNSYIGIALAYGMVGLTLFAGVFACAIWELLRGLHLARPTDELHVLGRSLLAGLVAVLVMISTLSSILAVPTVYWLLAGLCMGYGTLATRSVAATRPVPPVVPGGQWTRTGRRA